MHTGTGGFWMLLGGPFMWLLWLLLGLLIFWLLKSLFSSSGGDRGRRRDSATPLEILQRRFARGEIDEQEFLRRRELLAKSDQQ